MTSLNEYLAVASLRRAELSSSSTMILTLSRSGNHDLHHRQADQRLRVTTKPNGGDHLDGDCGFGFGGDRVMDDLEAAWSEPPTAPPCSKIHGAIAINDEWVRLLHQALPCTKADVAINSRRLRLCGIVLQAGLNHKTGEFSVFVFQPGGWFHCISSIVYTPRHRGHPESERCLAVFHYCFGLARRRRRHVSHRDHTGWMGCRSNWNPLKAILPRR